MQAIEHITVERLALLKALDPEWLRRTFGLADDRYKGQDAVRIPYFDARGALLHYRYRLADGTMASRRGTPLVLYNLQHVSLATTGQIWLCEGESDTWTLWLHEIPVVGIASALGWRREYAVMFAKVPTLYLWVDADVPGQRLAERLTASIHRVRVVRGDLSAKDPSALYLQCRERGVSFVDTLRERAATAEPLVVPATRPSRSPSALRGIRSPSPRIERARAVSAVQLLERRGVRFLRGSGAHRHCWCPLPGHTDHKPSFRLHVETGRWICFGCQRSGRDVIALVQALDGVGFLEAVYRLTQPAETPSV
jgi:hypothetical protein